MFWLVIHCEQTLSTPVCLRNKKYSAACFLSCCWLGPTRRLVLVYKVPSSDAEGDSACHKCAASSATAYLRRAGAACGGRGPGAGHAPGAPRLLHRGLLPGQARVLYATQDSRFIPTVPHPVCLTACLHGTLTHEVAKGQHISFPHGVPRSMLACYSPANKANHCSAVAVAVDALVYPALILRIICKLEVWARV